MVQTLAILTRWFLIIVIVLGARHVAACSCMPRSANQFLESAALVFDGKAEESDNRAGRVRFRISTLYKGHIDGEVIDMVFHAGPGASCGIAFKPGSEGLFAGYVVRGKDGRVIFSAGGLCSQVFGRNRVTYQPSLDAYRYAVEEARNKVRGAPASMDALLALAQLEDSRKDHLAVVRTLSRIEALVPGDAEVKARKGTAYAGLQQWESALEEYQRALEVAPGNESARRGRDQALLKLGRFMEIDPSRRDFSGMELPKTNFSGRDLEGAQFRKARLEGANFAGARLANADFSQAFVGVASFRAADLRTARLNGLQSYQADFSGSDVRGADFQGAQLRFGRFDGAKLDGANFEGAYLESAFLTNTQFVRTRLSGANLMLADLSGSDLSHLDLSSLQMQGASFRNARLVNANLRNALLAGPSRGFRNNERLHGPGKPADFRGADLTGAQLEGSDFRYALFDCRTKWPKDIEVSKQILIPVSSRECPGPPIATALFQKPRTLREKPGRIGGERAETRGPRLEKLDFSDADFSGAGFSGFAFWHVDLRRTAFRGADLRNADFQGSDIRGADFTDSDLTGATFASVTYDESTRWPTGFDVTKAGPPSGSSVPRTK